MAKPTLNAISVSDVHMGRSNVNNTKLIDQAIDAMVRSTAVSQANTVFLLGDWWDRLLNLNYPFLGDILLGMTTILQSIAERGQRFYVLRGTLSHDWEQNQLWQTLNQGLEVKADLHYIDEITVVHDERFGLDYLFIPDDTHYDPAVTLSMVHDVLANAGVDQVDYAFMHGMFGHQCPQGIDLPHHDYDAYAKLVRKAIYIGHVHTRSEHGIAFAQGSLGRTSHGEEEPKGFYHFWDTAGGHTNLFIENLKAEPFVTVPCQTLTTPEVFAKCQAYAERYGEGANFRIEVESTHPILQNLSELYRHVPSVRFTEPKRIGPKPKTAKGQIRSIVEHVTPTAINRDNVGSLVTKRVTERCGLNPEQLELLATLTEAIR